MFTRVLVSGFLLTLCITIDYILVVYTLLVYSLYQDIHFHILVVFTLLFCLITEQLLRSRLGSFKWHFLGSNSNMTLDFCDQPFPDPI